MALGGGVFLTQNKILPGSYINFVSAARASSTLSERGIATIPLSLDWGADGAVFTVTAEDFKRNSLKIFGYPYEHDKMKNLRELFQNIRMGHFYKLNSEGVKASNAFATAKCSGIRGNALKIVIEASENDAEGNPRYDVSTYMGTAKVDVQTVSAMGDLKGNDYVSFIAEAQIALTAGTPLTGGTDGLISGASYQNYFDKIEPFSFNTMGCPSAESTIKKMFESFTKRMRNNVGAKFQCVIFRPEKADFEGVIGVENSVAGSNDDPSMVYWVTGVQAGCAVNMSLTNTAYTGEYDVAIDYTQIELEAGLLSGKFMLHRVNDEARVLEDINTFVSVADDKSGDFSSNQTIRVLDQIGNDIASIFNTKYLGKLPNDAAGRISLWSDIVRHHQELQSLRAIEDFEPDRVTVEQGDSKKAVVVEDYVTPVNAMAQLYMTVVVQ